MCTVSFVPLNSSVLITSNRDESISRGLTLYPKEYKINNIKCTFPKDEKSLGTWIGYNEFNDVAVLLNGAFIKHESKTPYKKSRGLIITEMLSNPSSINDLEQQNFTDIEPFTLIVYSKEKLFEYKINFINKSLKEGVENEKLGIIFPSSLENRKNINK